MMRSSVLALALVSVGVASAQDDGKKELKKLQGTWQVVSAQENGKPVPDEVVQNLKLVVKGKQLTLKGVENLIEKFGKITLTVDPATTPKIIDFKVESGSEKDNKYEGIYELKGGEWKICSATVSGGNRPGEFEAKEGSNRVLFVLKKAP
jgi:uncharacterized protein (TIGR03067 family)